MTTSTCRRTKGIDADAVRMLSFERTVDRWLVHKAAVAEVLLTDWKQVGEDRFLVAGQFPRTHTLFRGSNGAHDPLLLAEMLRQAGILLSHEVYTVPRGHRFLMGELSFRVDHSALVHGAEPSNVVLDVEVQDVVRRRDEVTGLTVQIQFVVDGRVAGEGRGVVKHVKPGIYRRVRWGTGPERTGSPVAIPTVEAREVGVSDRSDVVVGPLLAGKRRAVRVAVEHPAHFDHALDHVPGMLVLETLRQAARVELGRPGAQVVACELGFRNFLDLDRLTWCELDITPGLGTISATVAQEHAAAVTGWIEVDLADLSRTSH